MSGATPEAAGPQEEQDHAEFTGWMEAQGNETQDSYTEYGWSDMEFAFAAGMQAQRDLDAAREPGPEQLAAYADDREADEANREDAPADDEEDL